MYFITTKRMLEVCFSTHPNIQYRTFILCVQFLKISAESRMRKASTSISWGSSQRNGSGHGISAANALVRRVPRDFPCRSLHIHSE